MGFVNSWFDSESVNADVTAQVVWESFTTNIHRVEEPTLNVKDSLANEMEYHSNNI